MLPASDDEDVVAQMDREREQEFDVALWNSIVAKMTPGELWRIEPEDAWWYMRQLKGLLGVTMEWPEQRQFHHGFLPVTIAIPGGTVRIRVKLR